MRIQPNLFLSAQIILCFLMLCFSCVASSGGIEVSAKEIPAKVFKHMQTFYPGTKQVKYFMQLDVAGKKCYKVKFRYKKDNFDLSFDKSGQLSEENREIDCATINDSSQQKIISHLNNNFTRYHIYKCEEVIASKDLFFEISIRGKRGRKEAFFDVYFTNTGVLKEIREKRIRSLPVLN